MKPKTTSSGLLDELQDKEEDPNKNAEKMPLDRSPVQPEQTIEEMKKEYNELHNKRGRKLDERVMAKICDMGNGCWTHHHFTPEIQTR